MRLNNYFHTSIRLLLLLLLAACEGSDAVNSGPIGQGGSTARFTVHGSYLYTAVDAKLQVFDLTRRDTLARVYTTDLPPDIETIHAQGSYLYFGAQTGMYIYSLTDPEQPSFVFQYAHLRSCDPVVVQGTLAYVTLRNDGGCGGNVNTLEIIDIQNPNHPALLKAYPQGAPRGLAVDGNLLLMCDMSSLELYDVENPYDVKLLKDIKMDTPYDVIASNGLATVTSAEGIFQYSYGVNTLKLLSHIPVAQP